MNLVRAEARATVSTVGDAISNELRPWRRGGCTAGAASGYSSGISIELSRVGGRLKSNR